MDDKKSLKVLVVDDEKVVRDFLIRILSLQSVEAKAVDDGFNAIEAAKQEKFDLVFLDIRMPKMDGLKVFGELKKINPALTCVFMTGYALEEDLLDKTMQSGTICLRKPFQDINQIKEIINGVLKKGGNPEIVNRRAFARLDIKFEIDYKVRENQKSYDVSLSKDVSPGGIRFLIQDNLLPGTILDLTLKVPGRSEKCNAVAKVVWNKESADKPGFFDTGLEFVEVNLSELTACILRFNESPKDNK